MVMIVVSSHWRRTCAGLAYSCSSGGDSVWLAWVNTLRIVADVDVDNIDSMNVCLYIYIYRFSAWVGDLIYVFIKLSNPVYL